MDSETATILADRVRDGCGLKEAIAELGLPVKQTLKDLRDGPHRTALRGAKQEQTREALSKTKGS